MLNPESPIPLYHQLADWIADKIDSGEFAPGDRIPSEHQFAAMFGIGRPTVRQAIDQLVRKQVLMRKRGSGTYVMAPKPEVDLFSLAGTIRSFETKGIAITMRLLVPTRLKRIGKDPENPYSGKSAWFFSRLGLAEMEPVLIEHMYLNPDLFKDFDQINMAGQSLSRVVQNRYFIRPDRGKQNFRIEYPSEKMARHLRITRQTPLLLVKRFLHFPSCDNGIFSEIYCKTGSYVFSQEIGGIINETSRIL